MRNSIHKTYESGYISANHFLNALVFNSRFKPIHTETAYFSLPTTSEKYFSLINITVDEFCGCYDQLKS